MVPIVKIACPADKLKIKCPHAMKPTRIVIHNTANDASARDEIAYMHRNGNQTSFHYAVDEKEIIQGIELNRNAWHAGDGNGKGNREGIAIEICYSKSGGMRFKTAQNNAAELTAKLLKDFGWGIDKVTKHQDYSGKHCPHRTLDEYGWNYFISLVSNYLSANKKPSQSATESVTATTTVKPEVIYQVWDDVRNAWLPNVKGKADYAGIFGHDVCAVLAGLTKGNILYKVHTKNGKWLPEVKNRVDYAGIFNKPIDGICFRTDTGRKIHYRAHLRKPRKWLPDVTGCNTKDSNNGYAGVIGQEIDAIQVWIE